MNNKLKLLYCYGYAKFANCESKQLGYNDTFALKDEVLNLTNCTDQDLDDIFYLFATPTKDEYKAEIKNLVQDNCKNVEKIIKECVLEIKKNKSISIKKDKIRIFTYLGQEIYKKEMQRIIQIKNKTDKLDEAKNLKNLLLYNDIYSEDIVTQGTLNKINYASSYKYAESLCSIFGNNFLNTKSIQSTKLWNWLLLYSSIEILNNTTGQDPKSFIYMDTVDTTNRRRHYTFGAFTYFNRYKNYSEFILTNKLGTPGDMYENVTAINSKLSESIMQALHETFFDVKTKKNKRGITTKHVTSANGTSQIKPGTIHRMKKLLDAISVNYALHSISDSKIILSLISKNSSIKNEFY